jgi:hypothetical protein
MKKLLFLLMCLCTIVCSAQQKKSKYESKVIVGEFDLFFDHDDPNVEVNRHDKVYIIKAPENRIGIKGASHFVSDDQLVDYRTADGKSLEGLNPQKESNRERYIKNRIQEGLTESPLEKKTENTNLFK